MRAGRRRHLPRSGQRVERLIARHDLENADAQRYVEERLRAMGVIRALEREGFEPGDEVQMAGQDVRARPGGAGGLSGARASTPARVTVRPASQ